MIARKKCWGREKEGKTQPERCTDIFSLERFLKGGMCFKQNLLQVKVLEMISSCFEAVLMMEQASHSSRKNAPSPEPGILLLL